jgi:site-specific DNA recombinase
LVIAIAFLFVRMAWDCFKSRRRRKSWTGVRAGDHDGFAAVREFIESVIVRRDPARQGGVEVTVTGRLNAVLGEKAYPNGVCGALVAGAGIEPATYGL